MTYPDDLDLDSVELFVIFGWTDIKFTKINPTL